jgi:hypothetical protein
LLEKRSAVKLLFDHRERIRLGLESFPKEIDFGFEEIDPKKSKLTVYNPAGWINPNLFAGRVESLESETDSEIGFFRPNASGKLSRLVGEKYDRFKLQDPFVSFIKGEMILGGVQLQLNERREIKSYSTVFYRDFGRGLEGLEPLLEGPRGMKDIRLVELQDHRILVFTRPQGRRKGGRGKVGAFIVARLEDLTPERIMAAPLIPGQFFDDEWGGVNAAYLLKNGLVGVLGHIARFNLSGKRQYYAVAWVFDPVTFQTSPMEIIFAREDLPGGLNRGHKRDELKNVIFPAQLQRLGNGKAILYGGEGDRRIFASLIDDPFRKFEQLRMRN